MEYTKKEIKSTGKSTITLLFAMLLFLSTLVGAFAFELDATEDKFVLSSGDSIRGAFIIEGYHQEINLNSDFDWISFEADSYIADVDSVVGTRVSDGVVSVPYFIEIPEDAEVGIYRTVIELSDGGQTDYLNIKISIQNGLITAVTRAYQHPLTIYLTYLVVGCGLFLLLVYFSMRFRK